ncbi:histidine kinase [Actinomadura craniellae]|uniref:histidine kinase n=1 Tax=Actinomadura craniellae TaxID=2231787 RepID=A0A365HA26_9ACTN|nr:nitrate- and nitrite sensing domain-containing protein [Actinomadura craniellae]RAY15858.1 histidine kinase [Actinomadura craniellae]
MRFRNSRLRTKVTALILSLTALWMFAAWVTVREGLNMLWVATLDSSVVQPSEPLLAELQQERRLTLVALGSGGQRAALDTQRARTDRARAKFIEGIGSRNVDLAASDTLKRHLTEMTRRLNGLAATRQDVDGRVLDRTRAATAYSDTISTLFQMYTYMATLDDKKLAQDTRTLIEMTRATELLSEEDALLAGMISAGRVTAAEHNEFVQMVGARRLFMGDAQTKLADVDPALAPRLNASPALNRLRATEDLVIQHGRLSQRPPLTGEQWQNVTRPALDEITKTTLGAGDKLVDAAKPVAAGVIVRLVLAGGLGLLAVIASVIVSITTARALVRQLEKLRDAAHDLADNRLPRVVDRLGHGETVDVAKEAPPLQFGDDEIGQVGQAFNVVQETAIRTAVEQAELRRGIRDILLSLARRSQTLVHRQLTLLDAMERREVEEQELEDLFRLDHLATRMRRNAENLIVLSGSTPARGWKKSVTMVDVVRAAVGEVEDYTRVTVSPMGPVSLTGRAVGDITHLLAELIENAVSFSPPYTLVQVSGHMVASGYAVEIEDRGLGMTDERLAEINSRIMDPPEFNMSSSVQLGLYVVGRLAQRYELQVSLKRSAYGGTTAVVLVPRELVEDIEGGDSAASGETPVPAAVGARRNGEPVKIDDLRTARAERPMVQVEKNVSAVPRPVPEPRTPPEPAIEEITSGTDAPAEPAETETTPSGLPLRVPQASLAPALRTDTPTTTESLEEEEPGSRSPEEIRQMFGSYQSGTRRGRSAAAKKLGKGPAEQPDE